MKVFGNSKINREFEFISHPFLSLETTSVTNKEVNILSPITTKINKESNFIANIFLNSPIDLETI